MVKTWIILILFLLFCSPHTAYSLYFLPLEGEGGAQVVAAGLDPSLFSFYVVYPQGTRQSLSVEEGQIILPREGGGDYRLYGDYADEESMFRSKILFSSSGRERTYSEGMGGGYLEILPLQPPEEVKKGTLFTGRVVKNGVPLEGANLAVIERGQEPRPLVSKGEGYFELPVKRPGIYIISITGLEGGLHLLGRYTLVVEDDTRERIFYHYSYLLFFLFLFLFFLIRYFKRAF